MASEPLTQADLLNLIIAEVGAITAENSLKWPPPTPGRFNMAESERQLAWVQALNGPQLRSALERHVRTLSRHGRGRISSWDVVNEPHDEQGLACGKPFG